MTRCQCFKKLFFSLSQIFSIKWTVTLLNKILMRYFFRSFNSSQVPVCGWFPEIISLRCNQTCLMQLKQQLFLVCRNCNLNVSMLQYKIPRHVVTETDCSILFIHRILFRFARLAFFLSSQSESAYHKLEKSDNSRFQEKIEAVWKHI